MTMRTMFLWLLLALLGPPSLARADTPTSCPPMTQRGSGGWNEGPWARTYDPKTVQTISGEVSEIHRVAPLRGMSEGLHALVRTEKGIIEVHLGPAWYLDHQDTQLAIGDRVEVRGSRVRLEGKPVLVAAQIRKGQATLQPRDDAGVPLWRGWR